MADQRYYGEIIARQTGLTIKVVEAALTELAAYYGEIIACQTGLSIKVVEAALTELAAPPATPWIIRDAATIMRETFAYIRRHGLGPRG